MTPEQKPLFETRYVQRPFELDDARRAVGAARLEAIDELGCVPLGIVESAIGGGPPSIQAVIYRTADARAFVIASRSSSGVNETGFQTVVASGALLTTSMSASAWEQAKVSTGVRAMASEDYRIVLLPAGTSPADGLAHHLARVDAAERAGTPCVRHDGLPLYVAIREAVAGPRVARVFWCRSFSQRIANVFAAAVFLAPALPALRGSGGVGAALVNGAIAAFVVRRWVNDGILRWVAPRVYRARYGGARLRVDVEERAPASPTTDAEP